VRPWWKMSNTYTQIHIHAVFAVRNRESILDENWRERLYKYIISIMQNRKHKVLSIGGTKDHIHILFGFHPAQSLSSLMLALKRDSSEWINQNRLAVGRFEWQEGYGAFSYSKSQIPNVIKYIENQEIHHANRSLTEEYRKILDDFDVKYDNQYILYDVIEKKDAPLTGCE
jgi:REP element-mobilizing transposase RayT